MTEREVRPYGLLFKHSHWYLVGWDETRDAQRIFRVDRMEKVQVNPSAPATPDYEMPTEPVLEAYRDREAWELGEADETVQALVRFRFPTSLWAARNDYGEQVEQAEDGSTLRQFEVRQPEPVPPLDPEPGRGSRHRIPPCPSGSPPDPGQTGGGPLPGGRKMPEADWELRAQLERIFYILPKAAKEGGATLEELSDSLGVGPDVVLKDLTQVTARAYYHPAGERRPPPGDRGGPGEPLHPGRLRPSGAPLHARSRVPGAGPEGKAGRAVGASRHRRWNPQRSASSRPWKPRFQPSPRKTSWPASRRRI